MNGTQRLPGRLALAAFLLAAGCTGKPAPEPPKVDPALASNVLDSVPSDIESTYIDFDGKVHLVGYKLEPADVAPPGTTVKFSLFWQPMQQLGQDWRLFTHVLDDRQHQIANIDNVGPLRKLEGEGAAQHQVLGPGAWQPGKVYVDDQTFDVPKDTRSPEVTITVGIWRGDTRLPILSGPSDGQNRAVVAHVSTGVQPAPAVAKTP